MNGILLTAMLLIGFSASAQSTCQVSEKVSRAIDETNSSGMSYKARYVTIKAQIVQDECVAGYLQAGDRERLAQEIMNTPFGFSEGILNQFVASSEAKLRPVDQTACKVSEETLARVEVLKDPNNFYEFLYGKMRNALAADACISSSLSSEEVSALAMDVAFDKADQDAASLIEAALAK